MAWQFKNLHAYQGRLEMLIRLHFVSIMLGTRQIPANLRPFCGNLAGHSLCILCKCFSAYFTTCCRFIMFICIYFVFMFYYLLHFCLLFVSYMCCLISLRVFRLTRQIAAKLRGKCGGLNIIDTKCA